MSVNKVIVIGNPGNDPDIRALASGQNVANVSVATTERFTDRHGAKQERTDLHRIITLRCTPDVYQCPQRIQTANSFRASDSSRN
jgi:single-strand DNA-binding protein